VAIGGSDTSAAAGAGGGGGGWTDGGGATISDLEINREIGGRIAFLILF